MTITLKLIFVLTFSVLVFGCSKEDNLKKQATYCENAHIQMMSEEFYGWFSLYLTNAATNHTMKGHSYVSQAGEDSIAMHIISDTTFIDTIILFPVMCKLVDDNIPCTIFLDASGNETGSYSNENSLLKFSFLYGTCQRKSYFEGLGSK